MGFKVEVVAEKLKEPCKYEIMLVDADTPVFKASKSIQQDYILVKHKATGKVKRYRNVTEWHGHWAKKAGGALKEINDKRTLKGQDVFHPEDFEIEQLSELNPEIKDHLSEALKHFDFFIGGLKRLNLADDYLLGIGGEGNFRKDLAQIAQYKGARPEKPLLFLEVKEAIIQKYKRKVVIVDGQEVDDWCTILGQEYYKDFLKTGKHKAILAYCDKDLKMSNIPMFNYNEVDPIILEQTEYDAMLHFCAQCLAGDSIDNIPGLLNFTEDIQKKYGLGKTKGIGLATALKYLKGSEGIKEMFERLVEAYTAFYGEGETEFVSWRGEKFIWTALDYLNDNARLLWLRKKEGEVFNIREVLKEYGINFR